MTYGCISVTFVNNFEFPFDTASDMLHIVGEPATYWRLDAPDTFVRPYNENTLFGRWNYPLGVTMYGLLHTAIAIGSEDIKNYIKDHVQLCIDTLEYALWDKSSTAVLRVYTTCLQVSTALTTAVRLRQ